MKTKLSTKGQVALPSRLRYLLDVNSLEALRFRVAAWVFIADDHDVSHLPKWVSTARQTTDGHLVQLAESKSATLETLDRKTPRAFLIPH